jgi:hypothetical protein
MKLSFDGREIAIVVLREFRAAPKVPEPAEILFDLLFDPPLLPNSGTPAKLKKAGRLLDLKVVTAARNRDGSVRMFAAVERVQKWHDKE